MERQLIDRIIELVHREVVPAIGCTEPVCVALCVARATELLGTEPAHIDVALSGNMLKNAMGVGIPGTGMIGLPIAIALGALVGKSQYGLEVLRDVNPQAVAAGRQWIDDGRISIRHKPDACDKLYCEVLVADARAEHTARAVIVETHTHFALLERDGRRVDLPGQDGGARGQGSPEGEETADGEPRLTLRTVWDFATTAPLEDIRFILESRELNKAAAQFSFGGHYGHCLGVTMRQCGKPYFGDTVLAHMIEYTSGACDARMGGAAVPVMSNSGSGNQGITATMPVVSFAEDVHATEEATVRALMLSHLTSIYIKQSLGRLSALCGCVVASTGASCGITYLMGGGFDQTCACVKNMVANLTGMLCDGAKPSCSMKVSSGVATALMSAMLAVNGQTTTSAEGIVSDDVDRTVANLTSIGRDAMTQTDLLVLKIMTSK